jgi:catechol 2,3-dioxygenase-like lactoylglutathione lyase family enzyme
MPIQSMDHFTVLAEDLEQTLDFYVNLLGLRPGPRPGFAFPGAWLYVGERAVLHVIAGRDMPEPRRGVLDHMAFFATDLTATLKKLEARGVEYELRRLPAGGPGAGTWQLFFDDPNGGKVELDFAPAEAGPDR